MVIAIAKARHETSNETGRSSVLQRQCWGYRTARLWRRRTNVEQMGLSLDRQRRKTTDYQGLVKSSTSGFLFSWLAYLPGIVDRLTCAMFQTLFTPLSYDHAFCIRIAPAGRFVYSE